MIFWAVFFLTIIYCARRKRRKPKKRTAFRAPQNRLPELLELKAIEKAEREFERAQARERAKQEKAERQRAHAAQAETEKNRIDIFVGYYEKELLKKQAEIDRLSEFDTETRKKRLELERLALYNKYNGYKTKSEKLELKKRGF